MTSSPAAAMVAPRLGPPPRPRVPVPERWTLDNGLRIVAARREGTPQVVLRLVVPAGSAADPSPYPGTAGMVGSLLTEGTAHFTADALNARLDLLGAAISTTVGHDYVEIEAVFLTETLAEGVTLLGEVVTRPVFPNDEVERVRAETLDALISRLDEPANVADDRISLEVFGADHPYGLPSFGTAAGIESVPRAELAEFHSRHYRPSGSFLVAAGDFEVAELARLLAEALGEWQGAAPELTSPNAEPVTARAGDTILLPWPDAAQSEIRIAGPGMPRAAADWVAAGVANYILGGSTITGRLGANLREDKGWTYGARSAFSGGIGRGGWSTDTAVDVAVTRAAVDEILREMRRLADEPVPSSELRRAKDALILSLPRAFETPGRIASRLATIEAYGLDLRYWEEYPNAVERVTGGDVQRIAREHFAPERVVRVVVGGLSGAE